MVLLRHGQSVWNAANKFTGWTDVDLSEIGEGEAEMTQNECTFCHSQSCPEPVEQAIKEKGYFIQKMEGCP